MYTSYVNLKSHTIYLTLNNSGLLCFLVWWPLICQNSSSIMFQLGVSVYKQGPRLKFLMDDNTAFCSRELWTFVEGHLHFHCPHVLAWNGIMKHCQEKDCSQDAVHHLGSHPPVNGIHPDSWKGLIWPASGLQTEYGLQGGETHLCKTCLMSLFSLYSNPC